MFRVPAFIDGSQFAHNAMPERDYIPRKAEENYFQLTLLLQIKNGTLFEQT